MADSINNCFKARRFQDSLKTARTLPIHKKGESSNHANFRAISIVPVFSKVIETEMKMQLTNFFQGNNLLSSSQHGFMNGRSTKIALITLEDSIRSAFEAGDSLALTLCDLSKAFDCVPHKILMGKT
ncbi:uncharacterized protein LOC111052764 [Nilaparvata lugens]|uniref:uncharacterized protein LOC111052764 n=1 Tax=Nilaparvata lugens TaxID=108931 RepID=UPI00193D7D3C|nr:uncharacterized protein LOC111052764 [Nilaparvata lugens]